MMTFTDIYNAHRAAAYLAYKGNPLKPNMSGEFAESMSNSWFQMYQKVKGELNDFQSYKDAFTDSPWYDVLWFTHVEPDNVDALDADYTQFQFAALDAVGNVDAQDRVKDPGNLWNWCALLARQMDATSSSPPQYETERQVVGETLSGWGDALRILADNSFDWVAALFQNLALIGFGVAAIGVLYLVRK